MRKITSVGWPATHGIFAFCDELDRIGAARVLRDARVGVVDAVVVVEHDVLQHRAEAERLEDVRLALGREVDRLGVAAAFDVEDAVVAPAVLVVADEMALRVGGERRLARAGEAEEQRRRAGLFVGRGRAVHREHAALRREVVRDREDALLHLAGVFGAEDDELLVLEAEVDARRRGHAGREPVRGKAPALKMTKSRLAEAREFLLRRADQHGVHEERVIRPRADDADLDAILRVPAGEAVEAVEPLAGVEVIERALAVDLEGVRVARDVHRAPPDVVLRVGMLDDALVLGRAAGLGAGVGDERAVLRDARVFLEADRVLVERARREVVVDFGDGEAVGGEVEGGGCRAHRLGRFSVRAG